MLMKQFNFLKLAKKAVRVLGFVLLIASLPLLLSACKLYTVVKINQDASQSQGTKVYFENNNFNSDKFVSSIWDSKVIPYISKNSIDISRVLGEVQRNPDGAGTKYGIRDSSEGSPWNYIVKGQGKVIAVNTVSRAGTIDIDLPPYDGKKDISIQVGPVIRGSSIRDSLKFISFDDFENQIEYAQLGNAFNKKVYDQILTKINFNSWKNKQIRFSGIFTMEDSSDILVTPITVSSH
jgi:predicted lipoprotein